MAPSLLAADSARLGEQAAAVEAADADWLHPDVMDGYFVPNISLGPLVLGAPRQQVSIPFDVHLTIAPADPYVSALAGAGAGAGADHITVHAEAGPQAVAAGATVLVAGTAVFGASDLRAAMDGMRGAA